MYVVKGAVGDFISASLYCIRISSLAEPCDSAYHNCFAYNTLLAEPCCHRTVHETGYVCKGTVRENNTNLRKTCHSLRFSMRALPDSSFPTSPLQAVPLAISIIYIYMFFYISIYIYIYIYIYICTHTHALCVCLCIRICMRIL